MKILSRICFILCCICVVVSLGLLCVHIYWGDRTHDISRHFFPPQSEFLNPDATDFSVAIASDTGANDIILETIVDEIATTEPRYAFMLHLGDFITHRTGTGLQWLLYEIHPRLHGIPMWGVPGNHDITKHNIRDILPYRTVMGDSYYWFGYGNVLFIGLDTSYETIDDRQFQWLENTLKKIRPLFRHCVIFTHVPPIDIRPDLIKNHALDSESAARLELILSHYKVNAMIFGHVHYHAVGKFAGTPIYTAPSSGQKIRSDIQKYGYLRLNFDKNGLKSVEPKYIDFSGTVREYIEYTIARDIFHYKLRETISYIIIPGLIFLILGIGFMLIGMYRTRD